MSTMSYEAFKHIQAIYDSSPGRREEKRARWIGISFVLVALCFPGYESLIWLKTGVYNPITIADAIGRFPVTRWIGVDELITWLTDTPVWAIPLSFAWFSFDAWTATH